MIRAGLSLTALVVLLCAPAQAQEAVQPDTRETLPGYQPSGFERAMDSGFEARAEAFGATVAAIQADAGLDETQRAARIQAAWLEFQPHVIDIATGAGEMGVTTAANMLATMNIPALVEASLANVDVEAEVERALSEADIQATVAAALSEAAAEMRGAELEMAEAAQEIARAQVELAQAQAELAQAQAELAARQSAAAQAD